MTIAFTPLHTPNNDELRELARRNPWLRFERGAQGELIVSPPTGSNTSRRNVELGRQLGNWNIEHGGGEAFDSNGGFDIGAVRAPDASWASGERWRALTTAQQDDFAPLAPDLIFELLSTSDDAKQRRANARDKIALFLAHGTRVAVLLDPFRERVETHYAGKPEPVMSGTEPLIIEVELLPGADAPFVLDVAAVFVGKPPRRDHDA